MTSRHSPKPTLPSDEDYDVEHNEHDSLLGRGGSSGSSMAVGTDGLKEAQQIVPGSPMNPNAAILEENKYILGVGYMLAMGVCGIVLVALGSTLESLAENCGTTSTAVGTVFVTRGCGAILGAMASAKLYFWFEGAHVMFATLLWITVLLIILPFNTSELFLHIIFLCLGLGTAITDTGCQIMTRKIHGKAAGPWLGANTVAFGISGRYPVCWLFVSMAIMCNGMLCACVAGACVPLIEIFTTSLFWQYGLIAAVVAGVGLLIGLGPNPEANGRLKGGPPRGADGGQTVIPHYHVEIAIAIMVFFFIGGKVTSTAYLVTYISETTIVPTTDESSVVLVLWIAITIGRLAGVWDQRFLTNKTLPIHLSLFCIGGTISMLLVLLFSDNADCFWVGVAFYGLFNGPCVGYCYDLNNRITYPTEKSMSIVMFGLNFGASLVPYATTEIWTHGGELVNV
jgi:predicted MFS family arabinose efflux permease